MYLNNKYFPDRANNAKSDIFTIGAILYKLITGEDYLSQYEGK